MLLLNQNSVNYTVCTLTENSQLWNFSGIVPYYMFQFTSSLNQNIYFTAENISTATSRYDAFNIIETASTYVNLYAGAINMTPGLIWKYTAYEQTSPTNIDPTQTISIVEIGDLYLSGETGYSPTFYVNTGSTLFAAYNASNNS